MLMVKEGLWVRRDLQASPEAYFAHSIICQFDMSIVVQEHVVQLQVTVDNSLLMQEVQSYADFSCIKSEKHENGWK